MGETHKIEKVRNIIIESIGSSVGVYGMNETIGRIYGLLYFEDEPLSLKKIAEYLAVSKATISINIRLLLDLKMVHKVWQKGSRKNFYIAERNYKKILQEVIRNKELKQLAVIKESINKAVGEYQRILKSTDDRKTIETVQLDIKKLGKLMDWLNKGESWLKLILDANTDKESTETINEIEIDWND